MSQQIKSSSDDAEEPKSIELLENLAADERFNTHVPQGTFFLTTSGKVPVERLRHGMTALDAEGGHRSVMWCKLVLHADGPAPNRNKQRPKTDVIVSRTRFPSEDRVEYFAREPMQRGKYWVVLSEAFEPVKRAIPTFDLRMAAFAPDLLAKLGEFEDEPEITNIFADYETQQAVFAHA